MGNKDIAIRIALQTALMILTGGITSAVDFWNRRMSVVAAAEAEGRAVTTEEQLAITDEINAMAEPVMRVDPGE